ncbi:hypothetical protein L3Y34_009953 [Caenorhabditis briggsae]|uniref:Uncharacterized protein n=1 Tax=Caenorhabditis briggsae TaxID=6238 RepID=A0AAE9AB89_CAEBR|nr:hypothetical protein L3Y34_009953 [Caenorhabditis briggsae]
MNEKLLLRFLTYIIFRFLHLLLLLESDIYALLLRLFDKKNENDEVEIFNIFARHRFDSTDATKESDFLSFHEKTTLFEEICEEGWHIYSITDRYVYFVKIQPITEDNFDKTISIEKCSKLSNFLYQNAEKLARCQLETFQRITRTLSPSREKIVIFHSAPGCGGTTVGKLLQSCDGSKISLLVVGEPPFLTSLSLLYNKFSIEDLRNISKSAETFLRVGPKTDVEFSMSQVFGSILNYRRNRQYFVPDMPYVEDLISDTAIHIRPLLDLCEISDLAIPECIEWKRNQEEQIQQVWDTVDLNPDDVARVGQLVDMLEQDVFFS